jgi:hypothetical protein
MIGINLLNVVAAEQLYSFKRDCFAYVNLMNGIEEPLAIHQNADKMQY